MMIMRMQITSRANHEHSGLTSLPLVDLSHVHVSIIESSLGCYCWTVLALSFFTTIGEHSRTNVIESSPRTSPYESAACFSYIVWDLFKGRKELSNIQVEKVTLLTESLCYDLMLVALA